MVVFKIPAGTFLRPTLFLGLCFSLSAQQSNLHTALFPRAMSNAEVTESESDSYNTTMAKRPVPFRPNSSDVLIGKAEEKFGHGRSSFQVKDTETARREFDEAIDLMLQASDSPTDRRLYEEKLEQMVDAIHRFDLAGLGAGVPVEEAQFEESAPRRHSGDDVSRRSQDQGKGGR